MMMFIISQCPVMVSLPALTSRKRAQDARGAAFRATPRISVMFPRPNVCNVGIAKPPAAAAVLPSVLTFGESWNAATSGAAPTPPESMTSTMTARPNTSQWMSTETERCTLAPSVLIAVTVTV